MVESDTFPTPLKRDARTRPAPQDAGFLWGLWLVLMAFAAAPVVLAPALLWAAAAAVARRRCAGRTPLPRRVSSSCRHVALMSH
jgi:hypothetical protein